MQLLQRLRRRVDAKGRVYISTDELVEIYRNFHAALNKTYWDTTSNHKVCMDAMEMLKTTHISAKNGRFLMIFVSIVSEVYSHAHYNVQELLCDDRYWSEILEVYRVIMTKAEKTQFHNKCYQSLALLVHFATLYSLYKDVAEEDFIVSVYRRAQDYALLDYQHQTESEAEQMLEYYDAIETIYRLRAERPKTRDVARSHEPEEAPTLKLTEEDLKENVAVAADTVDVVPSKEELYAIYEKALAKHKTMVMKKQEVADEEASKESDGISESHSDYQCEKRSADDHHHRISRKISRNPSVHLVVSEEELEKAIKNLNSSISSRSMSLDSTQPASDEIVESESLDEKLVSSNCAVPSSAERRATVTCVPVEHTQKILQNFDFREEFERRFRQKKIITSPMKMPIIAKSPRDNIVRSYRRKALFDDVEFPKPIAIHQISSYNASEDATVTTVTGMRTVRRSSSNAEVLDSDKKTDVEPNNNKVTSDSIVTEKLIKAGLIDKPVSSISSSNRRTSMVV